jgi:hypothetical protein
MDPARMYESLTPRPELENSQGQKLHPTCSWIMRPYLKVVSNLCKHSL